MTISRRQFVYRSAALAGAACLGEGAGLFAAPAPRSRVALVRHPDLFDAAGEVRADIAAQMLDQAVSALYDGVEAAAAWQRLLTPTDVLGVKSNAWRRLPTPAAIEQAIVQRARQVGIPEGRIAVDDRGVLANPVFRQATALINTRPMRAHAWAGMGTCIKNYIMFVAEPALYHPDSCADLATLWKLPAVLGKTRLNVLVMFSPLFHGVGPHDFNPAYVWRYNGLIAGVDPVAVDATGLRIIEAKRREHFGEERPISPPVKHVALADTRHGLGNADPARIDLKIVGWRDGLLLP